MRRRAFMSSRWTPPVREEVSRPCWRERRRRYWRGRTGSIPPPIPGLVLSPFARVPGILPGIWGALVMLGIAVTFALQSLVIASDHLAAGPWWVVSLVTIVVGIVGAKVWFIVLHRRAHRMEGWCIQGFIVGATLAAAILLVVLDMPNSVLLDMTAPGLLVAIAVGRVGCFFAGCCGGTPTASRWGVWSSDQRVGARRIPTQLLESVPALSLGLGVLVPVLGPGPGGRALFLGRLAAYPLGGTGLSAPGRAR